MEKSAKWSPPLTSLVIFILNVSETTDIYPPKAMATDLQKQPLPYLKYGYEEKEGSNRDANSRRSSTVSLNISNTEFEL